jgi:hypothetical protein
VSSRAWLLHHRRMVVTVNREVHEVLPEAASAYRNSDLMRCLRALQVVFALDPVGEEP